VPPWLLSIAEGVIEHIFHSAPGLGGAERQICSHKIEFSFLNDNLIALASQLFIFMVTPPHR
jgi:hypothetical protein